MKKFLEIGNRYAQKSDWKDFAMAKFCLCSMGIMIGLNVPAKLKDKVLKVAAGIFVGTYVPLMTKTFFIIKDMLNEVDD